jgi:hypothetical protein
MIQWRLVLAKIALYRIGDGQELLLAQGAAELNDEQVTRPWIRTAREKVETTGAQISARSTPLRALAAELKRLDFHIPTLSVIDWYTPALITAHRNGSLISSSTNWAV